MSLIDKFLDKLGYVKKSQVNPLDPQKPNFPNPDQDSLIKKPDATQDGLVNTNNQQDIGNNAVGTQPQQLSGDPTNMQQTVNNDKGQDPSQVTVQTPFDRVMDSTGKMPTNTIHMNNVPLNKPIYTQQDVDQMYHPSVAQKLHKAGIMSVDKELFDKNYEKLLKKAALEKKSITEYLNDK